jgi:hypothetical protein
MNARKSRGGKRAASPLNEGLDKNLRAYATAATADSAEGCDKNFGYGAAATAIGLGMLACALPAHAKIVYTPAHVVLNDKTFTALDLNHDGISDFTFAFLSGDGSALLVGPNLSATDGNTVVHSGLYASALRAGVRVGGGKVKPPKLGVSYRMAVKNFQCASNSCRHYTSTFRGRWANGGKGVKNRYLGFKVMIKGKVHYGWARVTVEPKGAHGILTGYAYETIANKLIITGKTKGPDEISIKESSAPPARSRERASLGVLALGAPGLSIWRREESMTTD